MSMVVVTWHDMTYCTVCCLWKRWINCGTSSLKYISKIWILYFELGYLGQYCNWIQAGQPGFDSSHRQVWDQPTSCWVGTDCGYVLTYIHYSFFCVLVHSFSGSKMTSHGVYRTFRTSGNIKFITISHEVCWEYSSQNADPTILWHSVMFPTETFEMRIVF